jgi:multiple sugar transport system ATP-binding protein
MGRLELRDLVKRFGSDDNEIVAVDDLNIDIADGEFLVLVGPSGCGKSTTLRMIAGLESTTSGEIRLDDNSIKDEQPRDRHIAMVFQNYALYPHMTARENMSFGLKMNTDLSKDKITERVERTAEMMGIQELLTDKPRELSGGQQQRVALGRAIVRKPSVFLMDEPLSNLDAKLRTQMRTELKSLQRELDVTTIYVTHDQTEAMTMGDRIAILNDGELQQVGTPLECYNRPANEFVAGFIGSPSMNFLDVDRTDHVLTHPEFEYELSDSVVEKIGDESHLRLGIRPEDVRIEDNPSESTMTATVTVAEPLGDQTYVYLDIGDPFTVTVDGDTIVRHEDRVHITLPEDRIHLFNRLSGTVLKNSQAKIDQDEIRASI